MPFARDEQDQNQGDRCVRRTESPALTRPPNYASFGIAIPGADQVVPAVHVHLFEVSKGPMSNSPTEILSTERIASLEQDIAEEAEAGRKDGAWQKLQPLRQAQHHQYEATNSL